MEICVLLGELGKLPSAPISPCSHSPRCRDVLHLLAPHSPAGFNKVISLNPEKLGHRSGFSFPGKGVGTKQPPKEPKKGPVLAGRHECADEQVPSCATSGASVLLCRDDGCDRLSPGKSLEKSNPLPCAPQPHTCNPNSAKLRGHTVPHTPRVCWAESWRGQTLGDLRAIPPTAVLWAPFPEAQVPPHQHGPL